MDTLDEKDAKPGGKWRKIRAVITVASLAQIDNVAGVLGTSNAIKLWRHIEDGVKGRSIKYAANDPRNLMDKNKVLGQRTFKTNLTREVMDWVVPGVPNDVFHWIEKKRAVDLRKEIRKHHVR